MKYVALSIILAFSTMVFAVGFIGTGKPAYASKMDGKPGGGGANAARYSQPKKPPAKKPPG